LRNTRLLLGLVAVLAVACGSLQEPGAAVLSGNVHANQSVDRTVEAGPLPPVAAGQTTRVGPPGGAVVIRSAQEYAIPAGGHFAAQFAQSRFDLDATIHSVAWTTSGTLLAGRKSATAYELVRVTNNGALAVVTPSMKSAYVAVAGDTAFVLGPAGNVVAIDSAGVARATTIAPGQWTDEYVKTSPDGTRLAVLEGGNLNLYDIATGAQTLVATGIDPYGSPIGWSWTGDALLFGRTDTQNSSLWRYDTAKAVATKLWDGGKGNVALPAGTPRGVVFQFLPAGGEREQLSEYWSIPTSGSPLIFLRGGLGLAVSRDGSEFSFNRTLGASSDTGMYIGGLP
jgi:hypothetical protein